jgi:hypothetical protein
LSGFLGVTIWAKSYIRSLDKASLIHIIEVDTANESTKVKEITKQALSTIPELTAAQIETNIALEEDVLL